ncbi:MAG: lipocalin family protein [Cellulophaga sp.]
MKRIFLLLLTVVTLNFSCSSDKEENNSEQDNIVGTWQISKVNIDATASGELEFAKGIIDLLLSKNCNLLEFTFNANGTMVTKSKIDALKVSQNSEGTGLEILCPEETEIEEASWFLKEGKLTITNDQEERVLNITLTENSLEMEGKDVDAQKYKGAQLIFKKV